MQITPTKKRKYEWQSTKHDLHKTFLLPKKLKENEMGGDLKNTYRRLDSQAPWPHFGVHIFSSKYSFFNPELLIKSGLLNFKLQLCIHSLKKNID